MIILQTKKYIVLCTLIICCLSCDMKASQFYGQNRLKIIAVAALSAIKKMVQPLGRITQLRPVRLIQSCPRTALLSLCGATLMGILLHRSRNIFVPFYTSLRTRITSLICRTNSSEEFRQARQELSQTGDHLRALQTDLQRITDQAAATKTEISTLTQEYTELERQHTYVAPEQFKRLLDISTKTMTELETLRDRYQDQSQQWKALIAENRSLETDIARLESLLQRMKKLEAEKAPQPPIIVTPQPRTYAQRKSPSPRTPSPLQMLERAFQSPSFTRAMTPRPTGEIKQAH